MNLQIIDQREVLSKDFKIYGDYDNPLFLAKDVANWIEHTDQRKMIQSVDEDEKLKGTLFLSGQKRQSWFLTEDGLYEVLMQSRKPIAKKFKKEVKKILKDVRKHGMYAKDELLDNPELMLDVVSKLIEEKNKRIELEQEKKLLESTIAEYEPKINYLDIILESEDTVTVSQIAQDYGMTARQFNKLLNELKVQHKVNKQWILNKDYKGKGYVKSKTFEVPKANGGTKVVMDTRWTQKGRIMLYDLLKSEGYYPQVDLEEIA